MKVKTLLALVLLLHSVINEKIKEKYMNLDNEEIMELSQKCGKLRFNSEDCKEDTDCMYIDHFIDRFQESLPFCFSYDELMRYYIKDDRLFLKTRKFRSHRFVNRDNICDILQRLESPFGFLNMDGKVMACEIRLE